MGKKYRIFIYLKNNNILFVVLRAVFSRSRSESERLDMRQEEPRTSGKAATLLSRRQQPAKALRSSAYEGAIWPTNECLHLKGNLSYPEKTSRVCVKRKPSAPARRNRSSPHLLHRLLLASHGVPRGGRPREGCLATGALSTSPLPASTEPGR